MPAENVQIIITDVDGVLTDGSIGLTEGGEEIKTFSVLDGLGVRLLQKAGIPVGFLSSRVSNIVATRAKNLGIEIHHAGVEDKLTCLEQILAEQNVAAERACFVGDDLVDLSCLERVGFPVAVANARDEVKAAARFVTETSGGRGAFRELAEHILRAQGQWETLVESFR